MDCAFAGVMVDRPSLLEDCGDLRAHQYSAPHVNVVTYSEGLWVGHRCTGGNMEMLGCIHLEL